MVHLQKLLVHGEIWIWRNDVMIWCIDFKFVLNLGESTKIDIESMKYESEINMGFDVLKVERKLWMLVWWWNEKKNA